MDLTELNPEERAVWERYITTGLHAFLFVDHVMGELSVRQVVDELQLQVPYWDGEGSSELGEEFSWDPEEVVVLAASEYVGRYKAFVHLWAPRGALDTLQDFIAGPLWALGCRCEYALQGTAHQGPAGQIYAIKVKRCDVVAVVQIWAKPGKADGLTAKLASLPGFEGAATVLGGFDVLLVLEGGSIEDVAATVAGPLQQIKGIARTESAYADYRRYH